MRKRIKKLWTVVLSLCMLVCIGTGLSACKDDGEANIQITEEAMRDSVVIGQEFDLLSVVENYDESLTYAVTELYYLDNTFEIHNLTPNGTKFTLPEAYKVYATLTASKEGKVVAEAEFTLNYEILSNPITDAFMLSWNDMGVSKSLNANDEYKYGEATHSIKAKYISAIQTNPAVGQFKKADGLSVTDWENAIVKMDVFNPQEEDFFITLQIVGDGKSIVVNRITLKAQEFTRAEWSLHRLGFANNLLDDGYVINVRVGPQVAAPDYNYALYFSNLDIVDYSAEQFPDMEWRTDEEILMDKLESLTSLPGETVDKQLTTYYIPDGTMELDYMAGTGEISYKNYANTDMTAPEGLTSLSYLQYDIDNNVKAMVSGNYHGYAIAFNNSKSSIEKLMRDELFNEFNVTDWENAYVGFWVYNDSEYALNMYAQTGLNFSTESGEITAIPQGEWSYVEWELNDFGYTENPFEQTSYFLRVGFGFRETGVTTANTFAATFYIDGFNIYNKAGEKPDSQKTFEELIADCYVPDARPELEYMHAVGQVSVQNADDSVFAMPTNFAGTSYLQYDITNKSTLNSGNYHGYAIAMDNGKYPINENLLSKFSVTEWSNAYVGFWVYNDSDYTLNMYAQHEINFSAANTEIVTANKGAWTYVEWALTDFDASYTTNPFELEKYFLRIGFGFRETGVKEVGGLKTTFYIAGFDIYSKKVEEKPDGEKTLDELLVGQYSAVKEKDWPYTHATGTVIVQDVNKSAVTMPMGFVGDTYLQYVVDTDTAGQNHYGYAIKMNKGIEGVSETPASEVLQEKFSVTDWSNAYMGFWVYQQSDFTAFRVYPLGGVNFGNFEGKTVKVEKNTWTYVEWKISDVFGYTENPFATDSYFLSVGFGYKGVQTEVGALDQTFYIAGFDIYTGSKTVS